MTGVSDTLKNIVNFLTSPFESGRNDDQFFEEMGDEYVDYPTERNLAIDPAFTKPSVSAPDRSRLKVVDHPAMRAAHELIVCEPRVYSETKELVQHLKDGKTLIVNLHLLDKEQSMRVVDFLCGCTYALDGNQQKIGDCVFIFTPRNINLNNEIQKSKLYRDALWNQPQ